MGLYNHDKVGKVAKGNWKGGKEQEPDFHRRAFLVLGW